MEVDHNGCNGNSTNSNVRGKKRSGNHLDHVEDLPPEKSSTDVTSVSQRRHPTHFEVSGSDTDKYDCSNFNLMKKISEFYLEKYV